jgi:hypothetical protein
VKPKIAEIETERARQIKNLALFHYYLFCQLMFALVGGITA